MYSLYKLVFKVKCLISEATYFYVTQLKCQISFAMQYFFTGTDWEYLSIAQACDRRTAVGLARCQHVDTRFFRKFPKLPETEVCFMNLHF